MNESLLRIRLDSVYEERDRIIALLSTVYPSYISRDMAKAKGWQHVVYIETAEGQLSWHISDMELHLFSHLTIRHDSGWDGHTTEEKYRRIEKLVKKECRECLCKGFEIKETKNENTRRFIKRV